MSPHLDDGVLSLGAAMASWARRGSRVELLTVFACDPSSDAPAGGWDARGGFATEGEAATARREEDRRACDHLGVTPLWLPFGNVDYERHGSDEEVLAAVVAAAAGADTLLLPGFPLTHPDHAQLARLLDTPTLRAGRIGRYVEPLYARREGSPPDSYVSFRTGLRDRFAKWRAVREYRSQLPLLGMARSLRRGPHTVLRPEQAAWAPVSTDLAPR